MLDPELETAIRQIKGAQQNGFITKHFIMFTQVQNIFFQA